MAPLPDNNTPVLFIDYTAGGQKHSLDIRLPNGATSAEAISTYAAVAPAMAALLPSSDSVLGARLRAAGSTFSFPITVAAEVGTNGSPADPDRKPNFFSVTGRSSDGRRVKITMFTHLYSTETLGYRINSPSGAIDAWRDAVTSVAADARTISGLVPVWNSYVNAGNNAYYQRKARRT